MKLALVILQKIGIKKIAKALLTIGISNIASIVIARIKAEMLKRKKT